MHSAQKNQDSAIPKPRGNYVNIPETLNFSKIKHNDYQVNFVILLLIINIILIIFI